MDRSTPLGNPYRLTHESMRDEVCGNYKTWFDLQLKAGSREVMGELERILALVRAGRDVELICWCQHKNAANPKRCHAETIRDWVLGQAGRKTS